MGRSFKFWISLAGFQVVFGLAIFGLTREYYMAESLNVATLPLSQPAWDTLGKRIESPSTAGNSMPGVNILKDPQEISKQANESFANQQYGRAAELYQRLLDFDPANSDTYNNLGLTLFYIGRTDEALVKLNEGIAINPVNQRIWLTLGYVRNQLGDIEKAKVALATAVEMDPESKVGQSAAKMLEGLP